MVATRISASGARLPDLLAKYRTDASKAVQAAVDDASEGMLRDFRDNLTSAFPGSKRAPTLVTRRVFPDREGVVSLNAAGSVVGRGGTESAWPLPLKAFNEGTTINAQGPGKSLAIPTARVPRVGGRRMTPKEVEKRFRGELRFIPSKGARGSGVLVLEQKRPGRPATGRRAAPAGQKPKAVVYFVIVPSVRVKDKLDFNRIASNWAKVMPSLIDRAARRLSQGSRG